MFSYSTNLIQEPKCKEYEFLSIIMIYLCMSVRSVLWFLIHNWIHGSVNSLAVAFELFCGFVIVHVKHIHYQSSMGGLQ